MVAAKPQIPTNTAMNEGGFIIMMNAAIRARPTMGRMLQSIIAVFSPGFDIGHSFMGWIHGL